jgi:hypothetical protein
MVRNIRFASFIVGLSLLSPMLPVSAEAQGRAVPRPPAAPRRAEPRRPTVRGRGVVFVGGYFYDPYFGRYPWWPRAQYPYAYFPMYDNRAELRVLVTPEQAAVYVDGFYAGIVDDFNGFFERLPLPPGGHQIVLYLEGFRTVRQWLYLMPDSTFKLQYTMERLSAGETSEPPSLVPPVPPPPVNTFSPPRTPPRRALSLPPQVPGTPPQVATLATLTLHVQPANAEVTIDGERWVSSDGQHFDVQVAPGPHRVDVSKRGYQRFSTEIQILEGEPTPLNVSLSPEIP